MVYYLPCVEFVVRDFLAREGKQDIFICRCGHQLPASAIGNDSRHFHNHRFVAAVSTGAVRSARLSLEFIMLKTLFLFCLVGALVAFLFWRRTPRSIFFGAIFFSTWIYAIAFWMTVGVLDRLSDNLSDGFLPYLPPLVPVAGFLAWFLPGKKAAKK